MNYYIGNKRSKKWIDYISFNFPIYLIISKIVINIAKKYRNSEKAYSIITQLSKLQFVLTSSSSEYSFFFFRAQKDFRFI